MKLVPFSILLLAFSLGWGMACAAVVAPPGWETPLQSLSVDAPGQHAANLPLFAAAATAALLTLAWSALVIASERAARWLALTCVLAALLVAADGGLLPDAVDWPHQERTLLAYLAGSWLPPALLLFHRHLFELPVAPPALLGSIALALTLTLLTLLPAEVVPPLALWLGGCVQLALALGVAVAASVRRRLYARVLLAAFVPLLAALAWDFARGGGSLLFHYALVLLIVANSWAFTLKYGGAHRITERLSAHFRDELERRTRELREKNQTLEQAQQALQRANDALKQLSITDGLTQVANRMYFEQQFEQEWRRCARQSLPLSVLMIDADHFKQLNDSAGHLAGDQCLQSIAMEIQRHFKRAGELVARYGGEEFVALLPDTNQSKALAVAEGLRVAIERLTVAHAGQHYRVTVSIGISSAIPSAEYTPDQLLAAADAALYEAKDAGRNRVHSIPLLGQRRVMAQQQLHL